MHLSVSGSMLNTASAACLSSFCNASIHHGKLVIPHKSAETTLRPKTLIEHTDEIITNTQIQDSTPIGAVAALEIESGIKSPHKIVVA